jgi:Cytochrome bd terminal oxidase subunit I
MDPILLSRLQFAAAIMRHFLFTPLTLGLSVMIAVMETQYVEYCRVLPDGPACPKRSGLNIYRD